MFTLVFLFILFVETIVTSYQPDLDDLWINYKIRYNKTYASLMEENSRRLIWEKSLTVVRKHNAEEDLNIHGYRLGINHLSDQDLEEFISLNGLIIIPIYEYHYQTPEEDSSTKEKLPDFVDWRKEGFVTEVKNQGSCGACWAFTAIGSLEGQNKKKTGKLVSLSAQNLIDCAENFGSQGCRGGSINSAYEFIKLNRGIDTEASYPYIGEEGLCRFKKKDVGATLTDWVDIQRSDENALMKAVATVGPVAAGINAICYGFKEYRNGVYDNQLCSSQSLNHAVLIVGYGTTNSGKDYWLVKNSWGTIWGEDGYMKMSRNKNNQCGIASLASYPVI